MWEEGKNEMKNNALSISYLMVDRFQVVSGGVAIILSVPFSPGKHRPDAGCYISGKKGLETLLGKSLGRCTAYVWSDRGVLKER